LVTFTVKPVAVATGVENVGVNAANKAAPATVFDPETYPSLVATTLTVADAPGATRVTVNGNDVPTPTPGMTVPLPTLIVGVNVYAAL
jgi:hypothetical protein